MSQEYVLKNVSEELVELHLNDCIKASKLCKCDRCRADVFAIALNSMPPQYVVTDTGDLFVRAQALSHQYRADVIAAITKGIMTVQKQPRHNEKEIDRTINKLVDKF